MPPDLTKACNDCWVLERVPHYRRNTYCNVIPLSRLYTSQDKLGVVVTDAENPEDADSKTYVNVSGPVNDTRYYEKWIGQANERLRACRSQVPAEQKQAPPTNLDSRELGKIVCPGGLSLSL